ncbi:MAG: ROK family protein, partial [Chloroflexi bacterium]
EVPRTLAVIDVGYGVGAGVILNGQLLHGDPCGAGEIGHVRVVEGGERCGCGHDGCLETVVSSRALLRRARAIAQDPQSLLGRLAKTADAVDLDAVCQALRAGDPPVLALVRDVAISLGIAAANLVGVLGSCRIILAGSVTCLGSPLLDLVREEMAARTFAPLAAKSQIEFASLAGDVVVLGASALVLSNELGLL